MRREGDKSPAKAGEERAAFTSELFTRKNDYRNTLDKLMSAAASDVQEAEKKTGKAFALAVAEMEERGLKNLRQLGTQIDSDLLLLSLERDELHEAVSKAKAKMLGQLKKAVKRQAAKERSP